MGYWQDKSFLGLEPLPGDLLEPRLSHCGHMFRDKERDFASRQVNDALMGGVRAIERLEMAMGWRIGAVRTIAVAVLAATLFAETTSAKAENSAGATGASAAPAESAVIASDVRVGGDDNQTRFIVDLSRKIDIRAFTLANPYRVIVDMPQVNFQFPAQTGERGRGLVKAFRYGLVLPGASRMVLDLTVPVRVEKAFVIDAAEGQPARLVLDLMKVDRETFLRAVSVDNRLPRASEPVHKNEREPANKSGGDPRPIIVIDPGHGGIDTGTRGPNGEMEKSLVLDFGLMLRDKIEKTGKYRVVMTRSDDTFVALADRVRLARARQAQLFISVHCDALARGDGEAQGATIYTLSDNASDSEAARLADEENRADVIAGVDLSAEPDQIADILIDLAQRETKTFSAQFARTLVTELKATVRLHKHPLKSAGFRVLKAPDVPSVLVELGFVSNSQDLKLLTSDTWRTRAGDSVVHAIDTFFTTRFAGAAANGPN
jgi:N-acetylmuramoyl-L-alanine amidase